MEVAREKLSKIQQQQGSCDDEEEAMVELITEEEHAIIRKLPHRWEEILHHIPW